MKTSKKLLASAVAASVLGLGAVAPVAQAEVSASVGIANMYLWRGYDLGLGDASVNGGLEFSSESGVYGGVWAGSGDIVNGQEYDLYAGFGGEAGSFSYDISLWTYSYPTVEVTPGDLVELVGSIGFGDFALTYYYGMEDLEDYSYLTASAGFGDFGILVGAHDGDTNEAVHLDFSYSYNENLTFTLSKIMSSNDGDIIETEDGPAAIYVNDDPLIAVSYSIAIE